MRSCGNEPAASKRASAVPASGWGPRSASAAAAPTGTRLWVEVSAAGAVWVLWQNRERPADAGPFTLRLANRRANARRFGTARVLDRRAQQPAGDSADADLALDPAGTAHVAWSGSDGTRVRAKLVFATARGVLSATRTLSAPNSDAALYDVTTSTRPGEVLVTWTRLQADPGESPDTLLGIEQVVAAVLEPDRVFAGEEEVSTADRADQPAGAFDPRSGTPTIVWAQSTGPLDETVENRRAVLRAATRMATG